MSSPEQPEQGSSIRGAKASFPNRGFRDALERYLADLSREGKAPATVKTYGRNLVAFGAYLESLPYPPETLADLSAEVVLAFRDHEIARDRRCRGPGPLSARTLAGVVKALRSFFQHQVRRGLLLLDPTADLKGPRLPRKLPREIPTSRQMRRLLDAPDETTAVGKRDRAILEVLYGTGLRNAELRGLSRGDVDLERRTVFVRSGKGGKERMVPMGKKAAQAVSTYLSVYAELSGGRTPDAEMPLFLTSQGKPIGSHVLKKVLSRYVRKAHLSVKATPHSLRHACATHLLKGGADIRQIQSLLGHASLEATQIYTRVETSDLRAMLDRHHPRSAEEM